jgi:hypothetical protein
MLGQRGQHLAAKTARNGTSGQPAFEPAGISVTA